MQTFHYPSDELEEGLDRVIQAGWDVLSISPPTTLKDEKVPLYRVFALPRIEGQLQMTASRGISLEQPGRGLTEWNRQF